MFYLTAERWFPACLVTSSGQSTAVSWPQVVCVLLLFLRLLKTQSLEWFYNNVKSRFKRFGSAKVLKTLYRKHLLEHSTLTELTGKSLSHSGWITVALMDFWWDSQGRGRSSTWADLFRSFDFTPPQQLILLQVLFVYVYLPDCFCPSVICEFSCLIFKADGRWQEARWD